MTFFLKILKRQLVSAKNRDGADGLPPEVEQLCPICFEALVKQRPPTLGWGDVGMICSKHVKPLMSGQDRK